MYQIAIVIFDEFTDVDFYLMRDILGRGKDGWTVRVLGTKREHRSSLGSTVQTDGHVREVAEADVVLLCSGYQGLPAALADREFMSALALDPSRQLLGSICAGSFILHHLGLLDGLKMTTHPDAKAHLEELGGEVLDQALVVEGNIATAGGCLSTFYLTGWVAERLHGVDKRKAIHRQLLPAGQQDVFEGLITSSLAAAARH
ncbi:DJ-1/PfpI family protein [Gallaecimonas sp. GXIMD4217]|uniref:DJ-1/PfpI family protein n=1 Tax=Gallaecimonas sp. GXIMD4217 TaxID=3131927 RepID=UPI00311AF978